MSTKNSLHIMAHYNSDNFAFRVAQTKKFILDNLSVTECVIVKEIGKRGQEHIQGYIDLKEAIDNKKRLELLKKYKVAIQGDGKKNDFCLSFGRTDNLKSYISKDISIPSIIYLDGIEAPEVIEKLGQWMPKAEYWSKQTSKSFTEKVLDYVIKDYEDRIEKSRPIVPSGLVGKDNLEGYILDTILDYYDMSNKVFGVRLCSELINAIMNKIDKTNFKKDFRKKVSTFRNN